MFKRTLVNLFLVFTILLTVGVSAVSAAPPAQEEMAYTVKVGDNLWALAEKYLGSGPAYLAIVNATNAKHEEDTSFAHIENSGLVRPGWKILIPGAEEAPAAAPALATAAVVSNLSNQPGRAIVTARGNHFVIDSVPPLEGPNEEVNPLDALLGALATCGIFIYEKAAEEQGIPLNSITATVQGDFNPAGVKDGSVNPRLQAFRVHMEVDGPDAEQAARLAEQFQARCPIYTTLSRAAPIEITHNDEAMSEAAEGLATATVSASLSNQPGRAIVSARGNHFVVDSVPPLQGPNEERNPLDLFLGALATCGTFVYEKAAQELDIPLNSIATTVEGDFNPAGVKDGSVDPRLQAFRVSMAVDGPNAEQAEALAEQFQARCPGLHDAVPLCTGGDRERSAVGIPSRCQGCGSVATDGFTDKPSLS